MTISVDGQRSINWISFAKNKLDALVDMFGDVNQKLVINGYKFKLFALGSIRNIAISAPPAVVVAHVEYPVGSNLGSIKLKYSEPYGAPAYDPGAIGDVRAGGDFVTVKSASLVGGTYYTDAPGQAATFPTPSELYFMGLGFYEFLNSNVYGYGVIETKFANAAHNEVGDITQQRGSSAYAAPVGGWQVAVGGSVFACYFESDGNNSNTMQVFVHGLNYRANMVLDLDSPEVQAAIGTTFHLSVSHAFIYPAPVAGKARLAVFVGPTDPLAHPELLGACFFDFTATVVNGSASLAFSYVGFCRTDGLGAAGSPWKTNTALTYTGGPVRGTNTQDFKSCVFSDGSGGVMSILRDPSSTDLDGQYSFTPGTPAVRVSASTFPADVGADAQSWPTVFRCDTDHLCLIEKIADSGAGGAVECSITAIYGGGPTSWTALPLPKDQVAANILLAARPVHRDASRTVILGIVFNGTDSFFAQYDSKTAPTWSIFGKIAAGRMLRPTVGMFGDHEYSVMAQKFGGSFPVTSWAGTHAYTGA